MSTTTIRLEDDLKERIAQAAERTGRSAHAFIVDAIAAQDNLRCTDLDFTKKLQDYAVQTGIDIARVEEYYGKPELASRLRFQITEEKVLEFLTSKAKIKEVTKA